MGRGASCYGSLTPKLVLPPASKGELFACPWGFVRCWQGSSRIWVRVCGSEGWPPKRLEMVQLSQFYWKDVDHFLARLKRQWLHSRRFNFIEILSFVVGCCNPGGVKHSLQQKPPTKMTWLVKANSRWFCRLTATTWMITVAWLRLCNCMSFTSILNFLPQVSFSRNSRIILSDPQVFFWLPHGGTTENNGSPYDPQGAFEQLSTESQAGPETKWCQL